MMIRKSMMSVAAATVLVTGFTGCSSDTNNVSTSTSAVVNENEQAKYTAPIQGLVVDDRGEFVVGATVTIGAQSTSTDAGGQYYFENVDISSFVVRELSKGPDSVESYEQDGCDESCLLVSIVAPEGSNMNNVVVEVAPEMVHIADANDQNGGPDTIAVTGTQNVIANSQSFTINSQVGTAMLTHKAANVKVYVGNFSNGTAVPEGTKVIAVYDSLNNGEAPSINERNYISSVNSVFGYTDANGMVTFNSLLTSSNYHLLVEGYTWNVPHDYTDVGPIDDENMPEMFGFNTYVYQGYAASDYVANLGNLMVIPINNGDEIDPLVATVLNQYGMAGTDSPGRGNRGVLMLQRTVTNTIEIMFTEAVVADDLAQNVKVIAQDKNGNNVSFLDVASVDLTGNKLTVTLTNDLTDGQRFSILLFRDTNLRDLAGNPLAFRDVNHGAEANDEGTYSPWIDLGNSNCVDGVCEDASLRYLSCDVNGRAFVFDFMAYKELLLDAEAPTAGVQMELDTDVVRTVDSDLSDLELYSNAFNNVNNDDAEIDQLNNVSEDRDGDHASNRLRDLANALNESDGTDVETDVARIKFTAGKATVYTVTVPIAATCGTTSEWLHVTPGSCVNVEENGLWTISGFEEGDEIEIMLDNVEHGDNVVITPQNDLCMSGTAATYPLVDNVAPTAVLQNAYIGGEVVDNQPSVVAFGEGGELTNPYAVDAGLGLPALYITPGLLDNLDENGNNILDVNIYVTGDESLLHELYIHNYADNNYSNAVEGFNQDVYDATDWEVFADNLSRDIGVSFSEDVDLTGVTPTFAGSTVSDYRVLNNVVTDDIGTFGQSGNGVPGNNGLPFSRDLVAFNAANVMTLANVQSDAIMSFDGIKDLAGNAADHANVKVLDGMPPMVTRAIFDGETVVVTFNEPIQLEDAVLAVLEGPAGNSVAIYNITSNPSDWSLDVTGTVLTVAVSEFMGTLDAGTFSANHQYDESALYSLPAGDYKHARLYSSFVKDVNGNSWVTWDIKDKDLWMDAYEDASNPGWWESDLDSTFLTRSFAMISNIGDFDVDPDNSGFRETEEGDTTTVQTITWTFNHPIKVGGGELFASNGLTLTEASNETAIDNWFEYVPVGNPEEEICDRMTDVTVSLDSTGKVITMTFKSPPPVSEYDVVRNVGSQVFTSSIDDAQHESVSASANAL